ncbi:MAG TPA: glycosyltransferase, partial [Burkholderiales bacterium]|nr:glycosyltransferase [Burkholderiales bacterium]
RSCFVGTLEARQLAATYAACDLYAWPALNEAYGMSLLEAQAAGVPVLSVATRGVPDVVMDGSTGVLVKDPAALPDALRALLTDRPRLETLGQAAAAFIHRERSLDAAAQRLGKLLAAL